MFQDIKVSEDLHTKFFDYLKLETTSSSIQNQTMTNLIGLDLNIYVLQVNINLNSRLNNFFVFGLFFDN